MNSQRILVPRQSTLVAHEARARAILRWLVRENIVEQALSTCGSTGLHMGHALAEGARAIALHPQRLPLGQPVNGVEVVLKRCIYTPTDGFLEEAGCSQCRREVGEPLFDSLEEWMPGLTDNFTCPLCGFEDDINGFLFLQPCAFSNLGFIFNNWGDAGFTPAFLEQFADWLDQPVAVVSVER
ncbi:sugar ABC transporter ATPase [Pseudomonas entomophila]|uniref:sugar ABC transporter ATPase n=1 Tax=Pseudomonas entomophila TaxID=312306 RepID=UPI003EBE3A64